MAVGAFFANLWTRLQGWFLAVLGALVLLIVVFWRGKLAAEKDLRLERAEQRVDAIQAKKESDNAVDALPPSDVDQRLDRWMRD